MMKGGERRESQMENLKKKKGKLGLTCDQAFFL